MINCVAPSRVAAATAALLLVGMALPRPSCGEGPATAPAPTRAAAIKTTLAALDQELQEHGGSWEAWAGRLKGFRADLERIRSTSKWPWPAKDDFRFQGKEMDLLFQDDLASLPDGQNPLKVILRLNEQLKARGIDLILMPIPDKLSIYPDYLSKETPADRNVALPVRRLMKELLEKDVEVVDLQSLYHDFRRKEQDKTPLYYTGDAHWRNLGAQLAAEELARRLARYDVVAKAQASANPYTTKPHHRSDGAKADDILVVMDQRAGKCYADVADSPIVLTGDSFALYNVNANAMASINAQVARHIGLPLTLLSREGLSGDMPVELARLEKEKRYLKGRRVVIWTFCTRMFVAAKWPLVDLPTAAAGQAAGQAATQAALPAVVAKGVVGEVSERPMRDPPYPDFIMKWRVTGLVGPDGKAIGNGDAVVRVLAMKDRKKLPAAAVAKGQKVQLKLVPWEAAKKDYGTTMTGTLPDPQVDVAGPHYWGELVGP